MISKYSIIKIKLLKFPKKQITFNKNLVIIYLKISKKKIKNNVVK